MTSISDIAKKAGVAKSTVSRVINHHPYVSDETRKKVMDLIAELDYMPNQLARDLSRGKTQKIGVVIPHTRHPYFTHLINGLLDAAKASDYQLVMMPSDYNQELELSYLKQLKMEAIAALIFTSRAISLEIIETYAKYGRIVVCEKLQGYQLLSSAYLDRYSSFVDAFSAMKARGLQHLVLLFSRDNESSATYQSALLAYHDVYGQQSTPYMVFGNIHDFNDGLHISHQLVKDAHIDGVLATSDEVAAGILKGYEESKKKYPYIIGQENLLVGQLLKLPTIDHKSYSLGKLAFKQALSESISQEVLISEFLSQDN
ncbi:LacI family DNA-binding transcriptional regulator [Streptococcus sp. SG1]|jgi:sugar-binding transcriptional regulator, lacI family|nr:MULTISPECIES: LacI family DNA-binding transcriptional regulator [Streptococcus]ARC46849.1 LacI family DNA-binding transcriptional regulator [Streptococcus gordonii]MCY7133343.1 LacI family DNA-binding transcriptional regulator [Streptococcus gordonii]MDN5019490.1 LacI family DNA-binding transcriptional regulator [Streptococcus sp. SG1]MDU3102970.1 LacI family DNA-binding transcriptional regulator [Streptococcus sp.]RSJ46531.1 Catabolite control protein B [Streptococcus gordonii]